MKKVTDKTWNVNDDRSEAADIFNVASFGGKIMKGGWVAIPQRNRNALIGFLLRLPGERGK